MNNDNTLIPQYRFPAFKNTSWKEKKMDQLFHFVRGPFGGALKKEIFTDKGYAVYEQSHAIYNNFTDYRYFITKDKYNELIRFSVKPNDLIMSCSGTMGKFSIVPDDYKEGVINQALLKLTTKENNSVHFLKYLLETDIYQHKLLSQSAGGAIKNVVGVNEIKEISTIIPELPEQQKIADCLSSLDDVIAGNEEKLTALEEHKKGLMQNLFPQEGETKPKYRFPEFENDGDWVEKKLGEVATFLNGRAYKQEELLDKGKYRVLRVGNFFTNNQWYYSDLELEENKYCDQGDLLYAWSASFGPKIWTGEKVIYHYHIWKVLPQINISNQFLYYLLDLETLHMKTRSLNGFALMHITKGAIENWDSIVPVNLNEQQKIASVLSSVDELIVAQQEKIASLKEHKKGLMQGLFPKIES